VAMKKNVYEMYVDGNEEINHRQSVVIICLHYLLMAQRRVFLIIT
jgi:hypothetical protein